jgi:hypothetical protein
MFTSAQFNISFLSIGNIISESKMFVYPVLPMVAQDKQTQKLKLIEKLKIKAIY